MLIEPSTGEIDTPFTVTFVGWEDREENYPLLYKLLIIYDDPNVPPTVKTWS